MTFKARSLATNSLVVCLSTICASGRADIFTATASDGNTSNFSSLKSSQDVGKTLVGQTIIKAQFNVRVAQNDKAQITYDAS